MKDLLFGTAIIGLVSLGLAAAPCVDTKQLDRLRTRVEKAVRHPRRIVVETCDSRNLQGLVSEAGPASFVLTNAGRSTTLNYGDLKTVALPRRVSRPIVAIIAAAAVGATLYALVWLLGGLRG